MRINHRSILSIDGVNYNTLYTLRINTSGSRDPPLSSSGSRRLTIDSKDGSKVAKPDLYYGEREKLKD